MKIFMMLGFLYEMRVIILKYYYGEKLKCMRFGVLLNN